MTSELHARRAADLDLARRCTRGEHEAQRAFFAEHRRRVHLVLYRILGSNRDIDDVVQDAFVEIFRSLPGFRGDAQLSTWIDRICVRVAHRHIAQRVRARAPSLELVVADDPARAPDRRAEAREAARRLYAILEKVEVAHRIAFVLHAVDGRPLREVADITGATVIATKLRVWRTRQRVDEAARRDPVLRAFLASPEGGAP